MGFASIICDDTEWVAIESYEAVKQELQDLKDQRDQLGKAIDAMHNHWKNHEDPNDLTRLLEHAWRNAKKIYNYSFQIKEDLE